MGIILMVQVFLTWLCTIISSFWIKNAKFLLAGWYQETNATKSAEYSTLNEGC